MSKSNKKVAVVNEKPVKKEDTDSESDDEPVQKSVQKSAKPTTKKSAPVKKEDSDDEPPVQKTAKPTTKKSAPVKKEESESDDDSESDDELPVQKTVKPVTKKSAPVKEDSDSDDEPDKKADDDSDDEQEAKGMISDDSDEESEDDKATKGKKVKETFDAVKSRIKSRKLEIKNLYKTKSDQLKGIKETEVKIKDMERLQRTDYDQLEKSHESDLKRVRSEKPKRKGNVNGGFNKEQPVPEVLRKFLNLADDAALPRPKVVAALHNKFKELQLKDKQMTKIDTKTATKLGLDGPVDIPFGKFQTWLAAFYPKVETKVQVDV